MNAQLGVILTAMVTPFDARGELVARLDSYECVIDSSLNQAFLRNQLAPLLTLSRVD